VTPLTNVRGSGTSEWHLPHALTHKVFRDSRRGPLHIQFDKMVDISLELERGASLCRIVSIGGAADRGC